MSRWNFEKDVRERFEKLVEDGWKDEEIANKAKLNRHWVHSYRLKRGAKSNVADRLQRIYDLFEDNYE